MSGANARPHTGSVRLDLPVRATGEQTPFAAAGARNAGVGIKASACNAFAAMQSPTSTCLIVISCLEIPLEKAKVE